MYSSAVFWITAIACLLAGAAAGWVIRRQFDPAEQRQRDLERRLLENELALRDYKAQVTAHFKGTAERVLRVCGCESDLPPRGCGTAPQPIQWYFELPAGMTFGGEVAVTYPVESSRNDFAGRANGPCPAQVPLP